MLISPPCPLGGAPPSPKTADASPDAVAAEYASTGAACVCCVYWARAGSLKFTRCVHGSAWAWGVASVYSGWQVVDTSGRHMALKRMILQEVDQRTLAQLEIDTHIKLGNACPYLMPLLDHEIVVAGGGTREEALLLFPLFVGSLAQVLESRAPSAYR